MNTERDCRRTYPLHPSQEGIYYAWLSRRDATCWNLPVCMVYGHAIDRDRLLSALRQVISRRRVLRLRLLLGSDGVPRQYVDSAMKIDVEWREMSEAAAVDYRDHHFVRPFDPFGSSPLCRFELLTTPLHHYLLFDIHHLIADGLTISHLFLGTDLPRAYAGEELENDGYGLPESAEAHHSLVGSSRYVADRQYFHDRFLAHPFTPLSHVPADVWGRYQRESTFVERASIDRWCSQERVAASQLFSAAFSLVLSRLSGERSATFLTLFHGRKDRCERRSWGMFVATLPQLVHHGEGDTIGSLLLQHRREHFNALRHSSYPLGDFCRDLQYSPMTTFGFQSGDIPERIPLDGHLWPGMQLPYTESRNELSCMIYVHERSYEIRVDASSAWHDARYLRSFAQAVRTVVTAMTTHPQDTLLDHLPLIGEAERGQLSALGRGDSMSWPEGETLPSMILRRGGQCPDAIAISDVQGEMPYRQLVGSVNHLSTALRRRGIRRGDIVAIALGRDRRFVIAVLGVMASGAAYLPLDPSHPPCRRHQLLKDSQALLLIDDVLFSQLEHEIPDTACHEARDYSRPSDMAYLLYTSGSSGRPKGVMVSHRALAHFVYVTSLLWHIDSHSRISCHASFAFDASVEDLFPVLTCGGTLFLPSDAVRHDIAALRRYLSVHHITGGCYVPQFATLLSAGHPLDVDYLCVGGDRMTHVPMTSGRVLNTYGPTEFTVNATYYDVDKTAPCDSIPIGRPLPNLHAFVMDYAGHLLPEGIPGELCLGGPQMAMGYWHQPEETTLRFVYHPEEGMTLYHTGDMVRWNADGQLEFIGRCDDQIALDGHRIEPAEIEGLLRRYPGVEDACLCVAKVGGQEVLCGYFVCSENSENSVNSERMEEALVAYLRRLLPSYMIPRFWQRLERLPLNANGKVDRRRLPSVAMHPRELSEASTPMESLLLSLFRGVLGHDDVGVDDSFFEVGGTSLLAMELVVQARTHHLDIDYAMLYRWSDVRSLARHLTDSTGHDHRLWVIPEDFAPVPIPPPMPRKHRDVGHLLLTGSTGFLGSHVLAAYLREEHGTAYCLVRGDETSACRRRLVALEESILGRPLSEDEIRRIHVFWGDLCHDDVFSAIDGAVVDTLIHCAANVNHFAPDRTLWSANVEGTRRVVSYCEQHGLFLVHLSTLSIGGIDESGLFNMLSETKYFIGQSFADPYDYTKFMAEHAVLESMSSHSLSGIILRPGFLVSPEGRPDLVPHRNDLLHLPREMLSRSGMLHGRWEDRSIVYSAVDDAGREVLENAREAGGSLVRHLHRVKEEKIGEMLRRHHPAE